MTGSAISSRPFRGQSGYYLYTPLELDDGRYLFVNRGFVPYDRKETSTRPESLVAGEQQITGLARSRLGEKTVLHGPRERRSRQHLLLEGSRPHGGKR